MCASRNICTFRDRLCKNSALHSFDCILIQFVACFDLYMQYGE